MIALDMFVVLTALTRIGRQLHASLGQLEWVVNSYTVALAVLMLLASALGTRYGQRRVLIAGLVIFSTASAICALAPNVGVLIAARALQGLGAAGVVPTSLTLVVATFPPARRGPALGVLASITGIANVGGPMIGGGLAQFLSWHWIFWVNVPLGAALVPLLILNAPETERTQRRLDLGGAGLAALAAGGVLWALIRGNAVGWLSPSIVTALVVDVGATVALVLWERRSPAPMLPIGFFAVRGFAAGNAAAFAMFAAMMSFVFWFTQFLQRVGHYGALGAGVRLAPITATLVVVAPLVGRHLDRIGERTFTLTGLGLIAAGCTTAGILARLHEPYPAFVVPLVAVGVGASIGLPSTQSAVVRSVPAEGASAASGTFNTLRQLGAAFGLAVSTSVATSLVGGRGADGPAASFAQEFTAGAFAAAGLAVVGLVGAVWMPGRTPRSSSSPEPVPVPVVRGESAT